MITKVMVTKLLQGWQVDDGVLLRRWQVDDNDKSDNNYKFHNNDESNNIRSVRFKVSHVVWSHNFRSHDHGIT